MIAKKILIPANLRIMAGRSSFFNFSKSKVGMVMRDRRSKWLSLGAAMLVGTFMTLQQYASQSFESGEDEVSIHSHISQSLQEQLNLNHPQWKQCKNIHFLTHSDQLQTLNVKGYTLIWYEMTGNAIVDHEVIHLLMKYEKQCGEDQMLASNRFKIVIDSTQEKEIATPYYKKPSQIVILKPETITPIPLNKYLSYKGSDRLTYQRLFDRINTQISEFREVNTSNLREFINQMGNKSYEGWIIMAAPTSAQTEIKSVKKKFSSFMKSKMMFSQWGSKCLLVTDEHSLRFLGVSDNTEGSKIGDKIYVMVPECENIVKEGKRVNIEGKHYYLYQVGGVNPENISSSLVFPSYLEKMHRDCQFLRISIDLNQDVSSILSKLYENIGQEMRQNPDSPLSRIPKVLSFETPKNIRKSKPLEIYLESNNFDSIVNVYSPGCRLKDEQKRRLITHSHKYKFDYSQENLEPDEVNANHIRQWIESQKKQEYFQSQDSSPSFNSERITGQQYPYIVKGKNLKKQINDNKCKVIFHYSEHCVSCNRFKHLYEEIAGERKETMDFYRIDNHQNRIGEGLRNYNSTPIFVLYRNGLPFYFKNTIFTKKVFSDFLDVTESVQTFPQEILERAVEQKIKCGDVLSEFK